MATIVQKYGDIAHFNKSPLQLFEEGVFPAQGLTLAELWQAYADPSTGVRQNLHKNHGKSEWLADIVDTAGAKKHGDHLVLQYFQRPDGQTTAEIKSTKPGAGSETKYSVDGKAVEYECPPDGWAVPGDGLFRHPLGTAIATVKINSRDKAVKLNAKYIAKHPDQFAGWPIPNRLYTEFVELFDKKNFDPENPTPNQLAELETSYQWGPGANTGLGVVGRSFLIRRDYGPFLVSLYADIWRRASGIGARIRE